MIKYKLIKSTFICAMLGFSVQALAFDFGGFADENGDVTDGPGVSSADTPSGTNSDGLASGFGGQADNQSVGETLGEAGYGGGLVGDGYGGYGGLGGSPGEGGIGGHTPGSGDPARGYMPGFGYDVADPEYANHERAIQSAIASRDEECSGGCTEDEKTMSVNEHYYSELSQMETSLPTGPMETMERYNPSEEGTLAHAVSNNEHVQGVLAEIDEGVRTGRVGVVMPSQIAHAYSLTQKQLEEPRVQLAITHTAVVVALDDEDDNPVRGMLAGLTNKRGDIPNAGSFFAGPSIGGLIGVASPEDNNTSNISHELSHAAEKAIVSSVTNVGWASTESYVDPVTGNVTPATVAIDYDSKVAPEDQGKLARGMVVALSNASIAAHSNKTSHLSEDDCASCGRLAEVSAYHSSLEEARAFASMPDPVQAFAESITNNVENISTEEAEQIAADVMGSDTVQDGIDAINEAAEAVLGVD